MSSDEQSDKECPLCMEPFEEVNFYPCTCQYQICTFCWHRLRTDDNGLCPACRQPYPEQPVNYQPLSFVEVQKIKNEKKQKHLQKNRITNESNGKKTDRQHLSAFRVLQRNLVYVIGLSQRLADTESLKKNEYFGKFGKIVKVAVGTAQGNHPNLSYTAYVTYAKIDDALRAIQAVNNLVVDGRLVKASLGTTKYCSNFLKGQRCHKQECMYLHEVADDELSFTKEDMHQGKHTEYERKLHEQLAQKMQQQTAAVISTSSVISNQSTSPSNAITTVCKYSNAKTVLNDDRKSNELESNWKNATGETLTTIKRCLSSEEFEDFQNNSESSNETNNEKNIINDIIKDKASNVEICNINGYSLINLNDNNLKTKIYPPPGFSKIITEKPPLIIESHLMQQQSSSSSNFSMNEHANEWFETGHTHVKDSKNNNFFHHPETFKMHSTAFYNPLFSSEPISEFKAPLVRTNSGVESLFQRSFYESNNTDKDLKLKLISSDSKSVMTCDELERILLNNSVPPGFKVQDSLNNCFGTNTTKSSRQTPVSSGINFFLDLYDDLGFDPFSESSKGLAKMLEEEKTTSASQ